MTERDEDDEIRVLVAEDNAVFQEGLRRTVDSVPGMEVVGVASNGLEALAAAAVLQPDVVLMDLRMVEDDLDGIVATRRIKHDSPHIQVLVLTESDDDALVLQAMQAGARGYLLKKAVDRGSIARAITAVASGDAIFSPGIAERVTDFFAERRDLKADSSFADLTQREREVLDLIAAGLNNEEIARRLHITAKTARNHVSNVFEKMQVPDRPQAIVRARESGFGRR